MYCYYSHFSIIFAIILICSATLKTEQRKQQFPVGSEHIPLPSICLYAIHIGSLNLLYLTFTLESMRLNPSVKFVLINIVEEHRIESTIESNFKKRIPNFHVHYVLLSEFAELVYKKLKIRIFPENNHAWHMKICDFKPTLAYLFPEFLEKEKSDFWAYGDMDLVWGNISRFSHLFHKHAVVRAAPGATGVAMFYKNEAWTRELFLTDPRFTVLLTNNTIYYNMDEFGKWTSEGFKEASHSISDIQDRELPKHGVTINPSQGTDRLMLEYANTVDYSGPAIYHKGSIKILKAFDGYAAGREVLCFHRPERVWDIFFTDIPPEIAYNIVEDMMSYGYFLPHWIPVATRYSCMPNEWLSTLHAWRKYLPFTKDCLNSIRQTYGTTTSSSNSNSNNSTTTLRFEHGFMIIDKKN